MQDAALEQLHQQISSAEASRGGVRGGLGFEKALQPNKSKDKNKLGGGSSSREFHTTSAGAVAAGHWDPWARPVEFKMKEVNRRVGGLHSMFVKAGTINDSMETKAYVPSDKTAEPGSSTAADDFDWKRSIESALQNAPGNKLKLKKLRKAVLLEFKKALKKSKKEQDDDGPPPKKIFKKRLKKLDQIVIEGKIVRLGTAK